MGEQQNFGIKTAGLEDKATACQMLVCYARELKEHFVEYTEQTVKLMVPMLKVILQNIYKWHKKKYQYHFSIQTHFSFIVLFPRWSTGSCGRIVALFNWMRQNQGSTICTRNVGLHLSWIIEGHWGRTRDQPCIRTPQLHGTVKSFFLWQKYCWNTQFFC